MIKNDRQLTNEKTKDISDSIIRSNFYILIFYKIIESSFSYVKEDDIDPIILKPCTFSCKLLLFYLCNKT